MQTISFAWTSAALLSGNKTVTRREWAPAYAARFRAGELVAAYDRQPKYAGRQIGVIRLTRRPYFEGTGRAPDSDYQAEGFAYLAEHPEQQPKTQQGTPWTWHRYLAWRRADAHLWVIRFELVRVDVPLAEVLPRARRAPSPAAPAEPPEPSPQLSLFD